MYSVLRSLLYLLAILTSPIGQESEENAAVPAPQVESALIGPLYLGETPPPLRTLALIWIADDQTVGTPRVEGRSREQALQLAAEIREQLGAGADWYELSNAHSALRNRRAGGVRGTVPKGMLLPEFDAFLFASEVGAISDPVENDKGVFIMKRVESFAGCRVMVLRGDKEENYRKVTEVRARMSQGQTFADLAKEYSSHPGSAGRGGQWAVYERGALDSHLKLEVFKAEMGSVGGPMTSGDDLYLFQRVPVEEIDPDLAEDNWIRVRSLLLSYDNAPDGLRPNPRSADEAVVLGTELRAMLDEGADMAELAAKFHDDATGPERFGDMGWLHKSRQKLPTAVRQLWLVEPGEVTNVVDAKIGFGFFKREQ